MDGDGCQANCLIAENSTCVGDCSSLGTIEAYLPTKLSASDPENSDNFGESVSISGDTLVVGAIFDDDNGSGWCVSRGGFSERSRVRQTEKYVRANIRNMADGSCCRFFILDF